MANIQLTTADTSGFIPQAWANRALDVLRNQIVLAGVVARDVNFTETGWQGKQLNIPYPGTFTTVLKASGTPVTPQAPSGGATVALTLANHRSVPFLIEDFANAQANLPLMDRYLSPATIALAEQFEIDLFAAAVNFTNQDGTIGTNISSATLQDARKLLNIAKAPMTDRFAIVSPKDEIALLADTNLTQYFAYSQQQALRNAQIGRLYGLDTYMSQLVPTGAKVIIGTQASGTFTLTFNGQTTSAIAFNAPAATVQAAVVALSSVGTGNAVVGGGPGGPAGSFYNVMYTGTLAGTQLLTTGSGASLGTPGNFSISGSLDTFNIVGHRNSIIYAVRPFDPIPASMGVMTAIANDPETGLSIRIAAQYDINNVGVRVNLDILYGVTTLRASQGVLVQG